MTPGAPYRAVAVSWYARHMRRFLKKTLRQPYAVVARNALSRSVIRHELEVLGATSWSAHFVQGFINGDHGAAYGLTRNDREDLVARFNQNTRAITSGTSALVHLMLAQEILSVPPFVEGVVVE